MRGRSTMDFYDDATRRPAEPAGSPRPYIGVQFDCCGVYVRIYRAPEADEYSGRCPRCGAVVTAKVGPGGTSQRIFRAK